jgi:hypothetical protein
VDAVEFIKQFQDHLAPKLDSYEQAIYLYVFRHSRLLDRSEVTIGFKSARKKMAFGIGENGKPMSETTADRKLQALQIKGFIEILGVERNGRRIHLKLPNEIPDLIPSIVEPAVIDIEQMDFFEIPENRTLILEREGHRCFYCLRKIDNNNYVIEHVVSRPEGGNGYRNLAASCLQCNNRKDSSSAEDFIRTLYRESFLASAEFEDRLSHLERLVAGELRPAINAG